MLIRFPSLFNLLLLLIDTSQLWKPLYPPLNMFANLNASSVSFKDCEFISLLNSSSLKDTRALHPAYHLLAMIREKKMWWIVRETSDDWLSSHSAISTLSSLHSIPDCALFFHRLTLGHAFLVDCTSSITGSGRWDYPCICTCHSLSEVIHVTSSANPLDATHSSWSLQAER